MQVSAARYKDKYKIAYRHHPADAPCLVFLHGFCEDSSIWLRFVEPFQANYRIVAVDLSGFGGSDLLPEATIDAMAEAVVAVLDAEQIARAAVIGHSMGGYVGLALAERHPERLAGLGLFHSHPFADSPEKRQNRQKSIGFLQRHGAAPFAGQLIPSLFARAFAQTERAVVEELIDRCACFHRDALIAASQAMADRPDRAAVLTRIACPVLFIVGLEDKAIAHAQSLAQTHLAAFAQIELLAGVGHMGMFEALEKTQQIVARFAGLCRW